jgi:hypothetical protein
MGKTAALTLALAILATLSAAATSPAAVTVAAQGDAWVTSRFPTRNFGSEAVMRVNDTPVKRAFVRFEVAEGGVHRATLRVFAETASPTGFQVYATSAGWTEAGLTHGNAPAAGALVATVAPFTQAGTWREIDVTSAVAGAGPVSFLLTMPNANGELVLTSREGGRAPELVLEVGDPPVPLSLPTIAGTLRAGETLTASPAAWTGTAPIAFSFQWQRCGPAGGGCADVPGATGPAYLLGGDDVDRTIRVRELATNDAGSASATSDATARIVAAVAPPVPTAPPGVAGTAYLGRTLTAVPGAWTGTPPLAFSYQWERCDAAAGACTDVVGATGTAYQLGPDDLGLTVRVRETAVNEAGSASAASAPAGPVIDPGDPPVALTLPTVAGTLRAGETLTASPAAWTGTAPIAFVFQWQRCGPAGGGCADVPGATGAAYLLGEEDVDRTIRVRELATNLAGSSSASSDPTARIAAAPAPPVAVTAPAVAGGTYLGWTLTAVPGAWTGAPPLAFSYQWERCDAAGGACTDVVGATATAYQLGPDDLGLTVRVRETAVNEAGSASAASAPAGPVIDPGDPPAPLSPPTIAGIVRVDQTLTAAPGTWSGTEPIAYAYQWQRCGPSGGGCVDVEGATGLTYLLGPGDVERTMRIRETASNLAGSASATSEATAIVSEIPIPPPPPPPSSGCSRDDATGCAETAGSRVSLLNQKFTCNRPLADIAAQNPIGAGPGRLPLLVEVDFTTFVNANPAAVDLRQDCVGDGDDQTIDLVLAIEGDGRTVGTTSDAIKVRLTARDVQLTGYANCGPRGLGEDGLPNTPDDSHQDGAQIQGGDTVEFIDFEWGDWETSTATCQGAAGTFVPGSVNGNPVTNVACIRCKSVSCNHGLYVGTSVGTLVVDSMWRTGNPADRVPILANGHIGLCEFGTSPCTIEAGAVGYTIVGNVCDRWPYGDDQ